MNTQIYVINFEDYATPGFASGTKKFFGTLSEIEHYIDYLKKDDGFEDTIKAFKDYKNGNKNAEHYIAYNKHLLMDEVKVLQSALYRKSKLNWVHKNVYGYDYYMKCDKVSAQRLVVEYKKIEYTIIRAKFVNLQYKGDLFPNEKYKQLLYGFWGLPHFFGCTVENNKICLETNLWTVESYGNILREEPNFSNICDEIFGDG